MRELTVRERAVTRGTVRKANLLSARAMAIVLFIIVVWISERSTLASDGASGCSKPSDRSIIFHASAGEHWKAPQSNDARRDIRIEY